MSESPVGTVDPSGTHEHTWQLVSVETEGGVEVRERVCTTCSAEMIDG